MIKYTRLFITFLLAVIVLQAKSQSTATTSSPYSRYGIGDLSDQLLPQSIGMGGISTAINTISGYNNINQLNPASYGKISFTTIDVGLSTNVSTFSKSGYSNEVTSNTRLSHISFAIPVTKHSALSFGLLPYSEMGYNYKQSSVRNGNGKGTADTTTNYIYSGDGGLSKVYLGYGFGIGKHLLLGANVSYIFGDLKQYQSTEIPDLYGTIDSRIEQDNHIKGLNYDYGIQYSFDFSDTKHLVLGYSASANSKLNANDTYIVSQYTHDSSGNENVPSDSLVNTKSAGAKLQLPQINRFGISYQYDNRFLIGADYTMGKWSNLSLDGVKFPNVQDSKLFNIGGQITPNVNALSNFFALIDYRLGFIYEQTYVNVSDVSIKRYAATFGLGIPLPHDRASSAFYKINFSAEVGQRGALTQQLIKENYVNFHLGFTLNDKWFQRFKFD